MNIGDLQDLTGRLFDVSNAANDTKLAADQLIYDVGETVERMRETRSRLSADAARDLGEQIDKVLAEAPALAEAIRKLRDFKREFRGVMP